MKQSHLNLVELERRRDEALEIARQHGRTDGAHHKTWIIDQMCRALLGDEYESFVADAMAGEDGPETYGWDVGIPP